MPTKITLKRGLSANIGTTSLSTGEPAFTTDTGHLYIGNGANKTLINPINKPAGLITTGAYPKVQVNEYGQVTAQTTLTASDIPIIPNTKITGLGTASTINTGLASGQIPTLNASNKLPSSIINLDYIHGYTTQNIVVAPKAFVPFARNSLTNSSSFTFNVDGTVRLLLPGFYFVSYNVTSLTTSLSLSTNSLIGSYSSTNSQGATPTCTCSASIILSTDSTSIVGIRNEGTNQLSIPTSSASLVIIKIG